MAVPVAVGGVAVARDQLDRRPDVEGIKVAIHVGPVAVDLDGLRIDLHQLPAVVY